MCYEVETQPMRRQTSCDSAWIEMRIAINAHIQRAALGHRAVGRLSGEQDAYGEQERPARPKLPFWMQPSEAPRREQHALVLWS